MKAEPKALLPDIEKYKKAFASTGDRANLYSSLCDLTSEAGLDRFFLAIDDPVGGPVIVSNWPSTLVDLLASQVMLLPILIEWEPKPNAVIEINLAETTLLATDGINAGNLVRQSGIGPSVACFRTEQMTGANTFMGIFSGPQGARKNFAPSLNQLGAMLSRTLDFIKNRELPTKHKLSKRELECIQWTSEGKTSYEISVILDLSENTVNNYIASVTKKLGAMNRAHMISLALRSGIIR